MFYLLAAIEPAARPADRGGRRAQGPRYDRARLLSAHRVAGDRNLRSGARHVRHGRPGRSRERARQIRLRHQPEPRAHGRPQYPSGPGRCGFARRGRSCDYRSRQDVRSRSQRNRDDRLLLSRVQAVRLSRPIDLCALYRHSRRHGALLHRLVSPSRDIHRSIHLVSPAAADRSGRAAFRRLRLRSADEQPHAAVPVALSGVVLPDPGRIGPRFSFDRRRRGGDRRFGFCLRGQCPDLCLLAGRTAARARCPDRGGAPVALAIAAARAP